MSVGHVARAVEEAGIPTVAVYVSAFRYVLEDMNLPRAVVTPHPFGRPMGAAGNVRRHREVVEAALTVLERATSGATIADMAGSFDAGFPAPAANGGAS